MTTAAAVASLDTMFHRPTAGLRWPLMLLAAPLLVGAPPLAAQTDTGAAWQWAASAGADSDYRFRGISLSDERPTVHLGLAGDHTSGGYGGASLNLVRLEPGEHDVQLLLYAGLAHKHASGFSWEAGVLHAMFGRASRYDYTELYAGLLASHWNTRLYYSPDYFGRGWSSLYAELNGSLALSEPLRAFVHVGALSRLQQRSGGAGSPTRYDVRAGLSLSLERLQWQLAWVGASRNHNQAYGERQHTLVLSVATFF